VANLKQALEQNAAGNFFVDSTCINCGVSRHYAPAIFGDTGTYAYVVRQPQGPAEELAAMQALLACPVGSIGVKKKRGLKDAMESFPLQMAPGIYLNGFNHRDSYGAHSYFIKAEAGNWLVDSPRFVPHLVSQFEAMGGVRYILLTHSDDVADAHRYTKHFGAERIIHRYDAQAQADAELILEEERDYVFAEGRVLFSPGHTRGHLVLLWQEKYLFSGDHFAWLPGLRRFGSFRDFCWHSWEEQIRSVEQMQVHEHVEWVFPGHGKWAQVPDGRFPHIVREAVEWMKALS
jgi:glyoxylase-like metal-dependent hydrolase (beta-lactamase superfamily II)/ferredoxin